jgi:hypothetical protein
MHIQTNPKTLEMRTETKEEITRNSKDWAKLLKILETNKVTQIKNTDTQYRVMLFLDNRKQIAISSGAYNLGLKELGLPKINS